MHREFGVLRGARVSGGGVRVSAAGPAVGGRTLLLGGMLAAAIGFGAVVLRGASPVTRGEFPLDDAWIHLDYARGLLRDGLPTYNPAEPEAGFSSPLWMLCAAGVLLVAPVTGVSVALLLKGAAAAIGGVTAGVLARSAAEHGASARVALLMAVIAPLGPWWATGAASGMEVTLTALLLSLTLAALLAGRPLRAGGLLALATLARPECAACVPALLLLRGAGERRALVPQLCALAAPTAAAAIVWVTYDLAVTGHPLPNTFYAKAHHVDLARSAAFAWATVSEDGVLVAGLLLGLVAAGLARARNRAPRAGWAWAALCVAPFFGVLASRSLNPAVLLYLRRYLYPFLLLLWWPAALGMQSIVDVVAARKLLRPRLVAGFAAASAALAVLPSVLAARALHAEQCGDIATFHTAPARIIAAHTPPDAVVAVEGAGAARFFGDRVTVDLAGLNEHTLVHLPTAGDARHCHLLLTRRPTWFVVPSSWVGGLSSGWRFAVHGAFQSDHYAQVDPPGRHEVLILRAEARPEALARCAAVSAARGGVRAPPSGP